MLNEADLTALAITLKLALVSTLILHLTGDAAELATQTEKK